MVKLSEQLQRERPTRTERVEQKQIRQVEDRKSAILKAKVDQASETMQGTSYEDYEKEYNKLDPETKPFFLSPEKLKQTEGYKTYLVEKAEYDKQVAEYNAQQKSIAYAQTQKAEWDQAEKLFFKGSRYDPRSPVGRKIDKLYKNREMAMEDIEATNIRALKKQGITPVRKGAVVVAYKDEFGNVSYDPELKGLQVKRDPDVVYQEWQETQKPVARDPIVEEVKVADVVDDRKWYEKSMEELFIKKGREKTKAGLKVVGSEIKDIGSFYFGKAKKVYQKIPSPDIYISPPQTTPYGLGGGIKLFGSTSDKDIKLSVVKEKVIEDINNKIAKQENIDYEKIGLENIKQDYDVKYQTAFENKYMKDLIYETTTFEKASTEFEQSAEAKQLMKDYNAEVKSELSGLGFTKQGFKIAGLGIAKTGVSLIPTTTKGAVLTAGGVYVGYGALKLAKFIPTYIGTPIGAGFVGHGVYTAFSPTSTPTQRAGGVITAGVSGVALGYSGYKYLRSPVIKSVKIPAPKMDLKASEIIGKDYGKKVLFDTQKLSQTGTAGRRTIVSTKIRSALKLDPIYEGVPISQAKYSVDSLRGSFSYSTPSGYQKALKKLTDYKYSPSQAKATLRYTAPKIQELKLERGSISIKGQKAIAEFDHLVSRPVVDVDELLGIKTRGAKTIRVVDIEKRILKDKYVLTEKTRASFILEKGKVVDFKDLDFSKGVSMGKATDLKKGYEYFGKDQFGLNIFKEAQVKDLYGVSFSRKLLPSSKAINLDTSRTKLISQVIDAQTKQFGFKTIGTKKTPLSYSFDTKNIKEIKEIIRASSPKQIQVKKIIDKIDDVSPKIKQQSEFFGKGLYEKTDEFGGMLPQQTQVNLQQLKSSFSPPDIKLQSNIKDLINIKQLDAMAGLKIGSLVGTKTLLDLKTDLKTDTKLKQNLKSMIQLKDLLKTDVLLKTAQLPALKTAPALKTQQKLKTDIKSLTGLSLNIPIPRSPTPPQVKIPTGAIPFMLKGAIRDKLKKKKKGKFEEFALLPDFTARAIGLPPDVITGKQAQARIKKILTGLEVRRGVRLK